MSTFIICTLLLSCVYVLQAIFIRPYFAFRHLPIAPQAPLYRRLFREPSTFEIESWIRTTPNDGLIRYFGFLNQERILLATPQAIKQVLLRDATSYRKLPSIGAVQVPAGVSGLVSAEGDLHKVHRRYTIGAFTSSVVRPLVPAIWNEVKEVLDDLIKQVQSIQHCSIWMNKFMRLACVEIFASAGLGKHLTSLDTPDRATTKAYLQPFQVGNLVPLFLNLLQLVPKSLQNLAVIIVSRGFWGIDISSMRNIIQKHIQTCIHKSRSEEVHSENRIAR
jgi:cytochrome P450